MITRDETVKIMHTNAKLTKIKKNQPEIATVKIERYTSARIILSNKRPLLC